jgi:hypothetical protein
MTNKEYIDRNIGLTFDFLRQIIKDPSVLDNIQDGAIIDFVEKDFTKTEYPNSVKPNKYIRVNNQFELIK